MRAHRLRLSLAQPELAKRSGVGVATLRRFERTGQISFRNLGRLLTSLGLIDSFLDSFKPVPPSPPNIKSFLSDTSTTMVRQRAPRRKITN